MKRWSQVKRSDQRRPRITCRSPSTRCCVPREGRLSAARFLSARPARRPRLPRVGNMVGSRCDWLRYSGPYSRAARCFDDAADMLGIVHYNRRLANAGPPMRRAHDRSEVVAAASEASSALCRERADRADLPKQYILLQHSCGYITNNDCGNCVMRHFAKPLIIPISRAGFRSGDAREEYQLVAGR